MSDDNIFNEMIKNMGNASRFRKNTEEALRNTLHNKETKDILIELYIKVENIENSLKKIQNK